MELDIKNAHNDFPRDVAMQKIIDAAQSDPDLINFAVAASSTLMANPIFLRSRTFPSGYDHICDSKKGGGQGNALTGQIYVLAQNDSLKAVEDQFAVTVKAIHDDIALLGDPGVIFGTNGDDGALGFLIGKLEGDCGLTINRGKCAVVGTTPDACALRPTWLSEPTSFKNDDGTLVETGARGIVICQNPIGEANFVQTFLNHKFSSICSVINSSFQTLLLKDPHAAFHAVHYSYQARFDYWLSTNLPSHTAPLAKMADDCLKSMYERLACFPLFAPLTDGSPYPSLTGERVCLSSKNAGLGFKPLSERFLCINSINNTMPQSIDRTDGNGVVIPGLWNSLAWCLGEGSFDDANKDTCWRFLHESDSTLGNESLASIARIKVEHESKCRALEKNAGDNPVLAMSDDCFGFGVPKLHRVITGTLRTLSAEILNARANVECAKDDQRRVALNASDVFSNVFPLTIHPGIRLSAAELVTALQRKLGTPLSFILNFVGKPIASSGNSHKLKVDSYGKNVAAAPGVKGDHFRTTHDALVTFTTGLFKDAGIVSRGGGYGSVKGIFSKCIDQSNLPESDQSALNGILPDSFYDGRAVPRIAGFQETKLHDVASLGEFKTLSTQSESVEDRARRVDPDIEKAAAELDRKYPGSTVLEEKRKYGKDGKYLALVSGSLGNLSSDFSSVVDFIASVQTARAIHWHTTSKEHLFSMYRRSLVSSLGLFASRLWARHIHDRFRDAVVTSTSNVPNFPDPDREIVRNFHSRARRSNRFGSRQTRA